MSRFHTPRITSASKVLLGLAGVLWAGLSCAVTLVTDKLPELKPSFVAVGTTDPIPGTPPTFLGTGFVVGDGDYVIKAAHVVKAPLDYEHRQSFAVYSGSARNLQVWKADIEVRDTAHDVALLKVVGLHHPALHFDDSAQVQEGEELLFTGFPLGTLLGFYPVTHRATVSAITPAVIPAYRAEQLTAQAIRQIPTPFDLFELDATAYPGNSGSALYRPDNGHVVGLVNMVMVKNTNETLLTESSGITYAIPSRYITDLMKSAGVKP